MKRSVYENYLDDRHVTDLMLKKDSSLKLREPKIHSRYLRNLEEANMLRNSRNRWSLHENFNLVRDSNPRGSSASPHILNFDRQSRVNSDICRRSRPLSTHAATELSTLHTSNGGDELSLFPSSSFYRQDCDRLQVCNVDESLSKYSCICQTNTLCSAADICCCHKSCHVHICNSKVLIPASSRPLVLDENDELEEKIQKLESEKNTLQLQVSVLSDQIEAQTNKIIDLEKILVERQESLDETQRILRKELENKASSEAHKIDLLNEISAVKLRCASVERENITLKDKVTSVENENKKLSKNLQTKINEEITEMTAEKDLSNSNHFGTMPRKKEVVINSPQKKGVAFGKGFSSLKLLRSSDTRCCSAPNLVDGVQVNPVDKHLALGPATLPPVPNQTGKQKKMKKIFSKWGSGSGPGLNLENNDGDFKRGGIRATSLARLVSKDGRPDKPFQEWDCETVCGWVQDLGLGGYVHEVRSWCKDGAQFIRLTSQQMEKELSIKNPLHRKKLELALVAERKEGNDSLLICAGKLDYQFIVRWLDDIGLPQYKDHFLEGRVDGRVLHTLTFEDLTFLKVTSMLHVASIRRGIQVLREQKFDPFCLKRRSSPEEICTPLSSSDVSLWTNHRVMEWLRSVDLAEYAPNLRGSGVHGGLLVYENKFTVDLLAQLLSIPANKSLLRRHLTNHFRDLIGKDIMSGKRYAESSPSFVPLSPYSKLKISRRNMLFPKLKGKGEDDYEDLVCPVGNDVVNGLS